MNKYEHLKADLPNYQLIFQKFYANLHLDQKNLRGSTHCPLTSCGGHTKSLHPLIGPNPWNLCRGDLTWQRGIKVANQLILSWGNYPGLPRWAQM